MPLESQIKYTSRIIYIIHSTSHQNPMSRIRMPFHIRSFNYWAIRCKPPTITNRTENIISPEITTNSSAYTHSHNTETHTRCGIMNATNDVKYNHTLRIAGLNRWAVIVTRLNVGKAEKGVIIDDVLCSCENHCNIHFIACLTGL